jgi:xanthine/CO dehydrogenase XdhC/CoxF family maturation factor
MAKAKTALPPKTEKDTPKDEHLQQKVSPRLGCEIYVTASGEVCVKQSDPIGNDDAVLVFTHDEALDVSAKLKVVAMAAKKLQGKVPSSVAP